MNLIQSILTGGKHFGTYEQILICFRYFPLVPGGLSHKHGYDIGEDYPDLPEDERDNPLVGETPRLCLPGREDEVELFYKVRTYLLPWVILINPILNVLKKYLAYAYELEEDKISNLNCIEKKLS